MFIRPHDKKLEPHMRSGAAELFFPVEDFSGAVEDRIEPAFYTVGGVGILGGAVHADDQAIQSTFNGCFGSFFVQKVTVGGGNGVDAFFMGIAHHVQKLRINVRFTLEVEDDKQQIRSQFVDGLAKEVRFKVAGIPGEGPQSAGAFRAAQIACGGGFEGDGKRAAPDDGAFQPKGKVVGGEDQQGIADFSRGEFTGDVEDIE